MSASECSVSRRRSAVSTSPRRTGKRSERNAIFAYPLYHLGCLRRRGAAAHARVGDAHLYPLDLSIRLKAQRQQAIRNRRRPDFFNRYCPALSLER